MASAEVQLTIQAPIEDVWNQLADIEGYRLLPYVQDATLQRAGFSEPNGVGAVRKLTVFGMALFEEVIIFEPPRRLCYRIVDLPIPIRHLYGMVTLEKKSENSTNVVWLTGFEFPIPYIGEMLAHTSAVLVKELFQAMLGGIQMRLEKPSWAA